MEMTSRIKCLVWHNIMQFKIGGIIKANAAAVVCITHKRWNKDGSGFKKKKKVFKLQSKNANIEIDGT